MDQRGQPKRRTVGGALAWLCATKGRPPAALLDLLATLAGAPAARWLRDVPRPDDIDHHGGLAAWLVSFLGDTPEEQGTLLTQPDPVIVTSAYRAAHDLAQAWRAPAGEMLGLLAGCLSQSDYTMRVSANRFLARSGGVPAKVADRVATVLDDDGPELRAQAATVLAHRGDARAVAPLTELLTRAECPWPRARATSSAPPQRLLDLLGQHVGALLPAVTYRLAQPGTGCWQHVRRDLLHGLATWHPGSRRRCRAHRPAYAARGGPARHGDHPRPDRRSSRCRRPSPTSTRHTWPPAWPSASVTSARQATPPATPLPGHGRPLRPRPGLQPLTARHRLRCPRRAFRRS